MQPQIVTVNYGAHNTDLSLATGRIIEGATWKRQRVIMLIPAGKTIDTSVYLSHRSLIFPPNQPMFPLLCRGMEVGEAYSRALEWILGHPDLSTWEYILTVEHDNVPPPDGVLKLIKQMEAHPEFACIGGLYWTKGPEGVPQIWGDPKDPLPNCRPQPPKSNELVECCATGMGFNLFRLSMFKDEKLRKPWFRTPAGPEGIGTQDLYFWSDAHAHGYRCAIDCSVLVGHHDSEQDVTW